MLEIRIAHRGDLPAIMDLLNRDYIPAPPHQQAPTDDQIRAFDAIAAHPDHQIAVATWQGEVVGTLQLLFLPGLAHDGAWRAQVEAVRVRGDVRNQRIGTRLMEWVIAQARARNCHVVQLTSNSARLDAHRFYERLGFKTTHVGMKLTL